MTDIEASEARFPVMRYRFDARVERGFAMPAHAGSALRGAFGHALREIACRTGLDDCKTCPNYRACAYTAVFETPPPVGKVARVYSQIPNPYVVEPPAYGAREYTPGEPLSLHMVLIGPALAQLPMITLAWKHALARNVCGGSARLEQVFVQDNEELVLDVHEGVLRQHAQHLVVPSAPANCEHVELCLTSPTVLRRNGCDLRGDNLRARDLLAALVRRVRDIAELQVQHPIKVDFDKLLACMDQVHDQRNLNWCEVLRYSNRQKRQNRWGGYVGKWCMHGPLAPLWPFLYLGQWLHVGKHATFGFGAYQLCAEHASRNPE